jgi:transcriptional regulator with XRE-family HTH domain
MIVNEISFSNEAKGSPMKTSEFSTAKWGNKIPALMDVHGLSVKDMADLMGVSVQAVYELRDNGVKALTAKRAAQLQTLLHTDFYKIFPLVTSESED